MARRPPLHSADELLVPALERTLKAIGPPESDAALVATARVLAATLDRMTDTERRAMLGQTAPQYFKVLNELEARARKRAAADPPARAPSRLDQLRAARGSGKPPNWL